MHPSVRVCGVSVRAPVKGLRGKCSRRNYRLVACATPYTSTELRKMRKEVLVKELTKHDLDTKGTKAQLIERIQTHVTNKDSESPPPEKDPLSGRTEKGLMRKKRTWLVEECEKRGLATNGKKLTLIKRLQDYIERKESLSASDFKKAVDEMQNLVAENGIKIKQRAERIMQKLQSTEEQDFQQDIVKEDDKEQEDDDEKEANEADDEAKEQEDYYGKFAEPTLADIADCIEDEVDLVSVVKYIGLPELEKLIKSQLRGYFSPFVPELTKMRIRKDEMIELITSAYEQEIERREKHKDELKTDQMAEMMAMDQLKLDTGVFIGDIDKSVDNLISEMRTEYGKHIPVEMEEPVSYLTEEELEELEKISEQDFSLETTVEEEVKFADDEYPESPMGGPDVDERDLMNGSDELFQVDDDESMKFVSGTRHRHGERKTGSEEARKDAFLQFEKFIEENKVDFKIPMDESSEEDSVEDFGKEQNPVVDEKESPVVEEKMELESEEEAEITQNPVVDEKEVPVLEDEAAIEVEDETEVAQSPVLKEEESPVLEEEIAIKAEEDTETTQSPVLEQEESPVLEKTNDVEDEDDTKVEDSPVLEEETDIKAEEIETLQSPVFEQQEEILVLKEFESSGDAEEETEVEKSPVLEQEIVIAEQDTSVLTTDLDVSIPDNFVETQEVPKTEFDHTPEESDSVIENTEPVLEEDTVPAENTEPVLEEDTVLAENTEPVLEEDTVLAENTEPVLEKDTVLAENTEPVLEETIDPVVMETEDSSSEDEIIIIDQSPVVDSHDLIEEAPVEEAPIEVDPVVSKLDSFALKEAAEKIFATHAHKELLDMSEEAFLDIVKPLNMDISPMRTEFIAKLAELADQELPEVEQNEDNLVELSLSQMDDEKPVLEDQNEIDEDQWVGFHPKGFSDENKDSFEHDPVDDDEPDIDEVLEETVERTSVKMTLTSLPKMDDFDNLNTPKITQVLNELRSQRTEWEDTTKDLLQFLQEKCDAEQQPQKKADLVKDIETLTEEYEDLKERVNEKDEEVVELQSKINSDEEDSSDPSKEQPSKTDLMKKHSSIAVTLAAGISEVWKHFFKSMDPKKERDAE